MAGQWEHVGERGDVEALQGASSVIASGPRRCAVRSPTATHLRATADREHLTKHESAIIPDCIHQHEYSVRKRPLFPFQLPLAVEAVVLSL